MVCDASVAGKPITHAESFRAGIVRVSLAWPRLLGVPKSATGQLLRIEIRVTASGRTATRLFTYEVR
jgi:hypothetical protein